VCGRLRWAATHPAVTASPRHGPAHQGHRPVLGRPLAAAATPPADAELRAQRLGRDLARHQRLQADIAAVEGQITRLLAATPGQILTTLPGVAAVRAASFAAHSLPIQRFPTLSTCTPPPGWPRPPGSQPACTDVAGSAARACLSTATRSWDRLGPVPILAELPRAGP
jgi:hypothetical protein